MNEQIIKELTTNNGINNKNTEYICLFCSKINKLKDIEFITDNSTLICNKCGIDAMIINSFEKQRLEDISKIKFNKSLFDFNFDNFKIYEKFIENKKKTCRVILYDNTKITNYWIEDLRKRY